jgi:hypothetical protein
MEKSYGHKVDKYALIYTAADEISTYLRDINDRPTKYMDFYMKQIDKAATFIRFVESVCIINGSEVLTRDHIESLWNAAIHGTLVRSFGYHILIDEVSIGDLFKYESEPNSIVLVVLKFQKECAEKQFATLTAPF